MKKILSFLLLMATTHFGMGQFCTGTKISSVITTNVCCSYTGGYGYPGTSGMAPGYLFLDKPGLPQILWTEHTSGKIAKMSWNGTTFLMQPYVPGDQCDLTVAGTINASSSILWQTNIIWQTNTFLQGTNTWTGTNTFTGTVNYNGPITTQGQMGGTSNVPMGGITMVFVNGFWIKNQ